jgi:CheY-like chemotaxis protein
MNILVVEDDDGVREVMTDLLSESARVQAVQSVADALTALAAGSFELIFADLRIRGANNGGQQIIAAARGAFCPVVIMTGLQREEMRRLLGGLQPDGVLLKPFAIEEALSVFRSFSKVWREVGALAGSPIEGAQWQPLSASVSLSSVDGGELQSGRRLVAWSAGAAEERHTFPVGQVGRVVKGRLSIDGQALEAGRAFFLAAGQPYAIGSAEGCVVALVSLPPAR